MKAISLITLTSLLISSVFLMITLVLSKKSKEMREKWTPFECGFNFFNSARMPFSMKFFLIAIIFIIFDVEIALIIPLLVTMTKSNIIKWFISSSLVMLVITVGTLAEWKEESFTWKN